MESNKESQTLRFTLSHIKHSNIKPEGNAIGEIINSLNPSNVVEINQSSFFERAVNSPWLPYVTCKTASNDSFVESSILSLDIDNKEGRSYLVKDFLQDCDEYNLPCAMIYSTFQDTTDPINWKNCKRYRAVFFLDTPVENYDEFNFLLKSLQEIFGETDEQYRAHMYCNGGRYVCYTDVNAFISTKEIALAKTLHTDYSSFKSSSTITRNTKQIFKKCGVRENNKPVLSGKRLKLNDINKLCKECTLFNNFYYQKRKIEHRQLFGLLTFLKQYQGGLKLFKKCITENQFISDNKIVEVIGIGNASLVYTNEQSCRSYLDSDDPALNYIKLSAIITSYKSKAIVQKPLNQLSLIDAEAELKKGFSNLEKKGINIIQFPVGIGKTQEIVNLRELDKTIIAVPNKKLMNEVYKRLRSVGHRPLKLIACETDKLPKDNKKHYQQLFDLGLGGNATSYLRGLSTEPSKIKLPTHHERQDLANYLAGYFREHDEIIRSQRPLITTHAKLLTSKFGYHEKIIIDEDITFSMLKNEEVTIKDFHALYRIIRKEKEGENDYFNFLNEEIFGLEENESFRIKDDSINEKSIRVVRKLILKHKDHFKSPIGALLKCTSIMIKFENGSPSKLVTCTKQEYQHTGKKNLIMSATMNAFISSIVFPKANHKSVTNVLHYSNALYQISDKSFSKSQMKKTSYQVHLDAINKFAASKSIITYHNQEIQNLFDDDKLSKLSIENCEGSDIHKGQKIIVVGTPNLSDYIYLLYARALGIDFTKDDAEWGMQKITDHRGTYSISTFKGEQLRKFHFYYLESRIIQAIGRARSLREEEAEVFYFGSFPIPYFQQFTMNEFKTEFCATFE